MSRFAGLVVSLTGLVFLTLHLNAPSGNYAVDQNLAGALYGADDPVSQSECAPDAACTPFGGPCSSYGVSECESADVGYNPTSMPFFTCAFNPMKTCSPSHLQVCLYEGICYVFQGSCEYYGSGDPIEYSYSLCSDDIGT